MNRNSTVVWSRDCIRPRIQKSSSHLTESKDPRKKDLPPRPSGQRPEPDRRGTGAFGNPFGNGNFQFSFGIGGFPFGLIGTFGNQGPNPFGFGQPQTPVRPYCRDHKCL